MNNLKKLLPKFSIMFIVCVLAASAHAAKDSSFIDRINLGIKLGVNFPYMSYSDSGLDDYPASIYGEPLFELFGEYIFSTFNSSLSVRPGLKFVTRGQHTEETDFKYNYNAKYMEITVPVSWTFPEIKGSRLYVLGGPVMGFVRGGNIRYSSDMEDEMEEEYTMGTQVNEGNASSYSFGLYFGAGIKFPLTIKGISLIPGFEAGWHLGLSDTYSDDEHSGSSNALNTYSYDISGTRKHRGLELGITLSVPIGQFKKVKLPVQEPTPIPIPIPEPISMPEPEPVPELEPAQEPEKICATLDEMKVLIQAGENIQNRKICAVSQISFRFGSYELTPEDKVYLDEIVNLMKTNEQIHIRVNGHTDNVGGEEFNNNLSRERARSVHDYLISCGIDASRLSHAHFGSTRPITDNDTEEGRTINRRVEFEIITQ